MRLVTENIVERVARAIYRVSEGRDDPGGTAVGWFDYEAEARAAIVAYEEAKAQFGNVKLVSQEMRCSTCGKPPVNCFCDPPCWEPVDAALAEETSK